MRGDDQKAEAPSRDRGNLPQWITPELLEKTLEIWQPYYAYRLTRDDALAIIKSVGRLIEVLATESES